jgi:hypothetical protein
MHLPALVWLTVVTIIGTVSAHYQDERVNAFTVLNQHTSEVKVRIQHGDRKGSCTFRYVTSPVVTKPTPQKANTVKQIELSSITESLSGICSIKRMDYWTYEVCFNRRVKQFHDSDSFTLGQDVSVVGYEQIYSGGDVCDALPSHPTRKSTVKFNCNKYAVAEPTIISVSETSPCVYTVNVGTAKVCSDPNYPDLSADPAAGVSEGSGDTISEDWFLEIVQLSDGRLMCSTYSNELRAVGSKLTFSSFELLIDSDSLPGIESPEKFTARRPGREDCDADEVVYDSGILRSGSKFRNKLAFLKIYG